MPISDTNKVSSEPIAKPLITVIVPIFNAEQHLRQCVESIQLQDYSNIEILLVDDGSTDTSAAICALLAAKDARIRVLTQTNQGVAAARNHAVRGAKGQFLCFVDADDWVTNRYVSSLYEALMSSPGATVSVLAPVLIIHDEDSQPVIYQKVPYGKTESLTSTQLLSFLFQGKIGNAVWGKLYDTGLLRTHNVYFRDFLIAEDFEFNCNAFTSASSGAISYSPQYYYRADNPTSAMNTISTNKALSWLAALDCISQNYATGSTALKRQFQNAYWANCWEIYRKLGPQMTKADRSLDSTIKAILRRFALVALVNDSFIKNRFRALICLLSPALARKIFTALSVRIS